METIHQFISDLITKYYFFTIVIIVLIWGLYVYFKRWPKIIRISLLDENNNHIDIEKRKKFRYAVNGNCSEKNMTLNANPKKKVKWMGFGDRVEITVKHPRKGAEPISRSEIKIFDRLTFVDFKFSKSEIEDFDKV